MTTDVEILNPKFKIPKSAHVEIPNPKFKIPKSTHVEIRNFKSQIPREAMSVASGLGFPQLGNDRTENVDYLRCFLNQVGSIFDGWPPLCDELKPKSCFLCFFPSDHKRFAFVGFALSAIRFFDVCPDRSSRLGNLVPNNIGLRYFQKSDDDIQNRVSKQERSLTNIKRFFHEVKSRTSSDDWPPCSFRIWDLEFGISPWDLGFGISPC